MYNKNRNREFLFRIIGRIFYFGLFLLVASILFGINFSFKAQACDLFVRSNGEEHCNTGQNKMYRCENFSGPGTGNWVDTGRSCGSGGVGAGMTGAVNTTNPNNSNKVCNNNSVTAVHCRGKEFGHVVAGVCQCAHTRNNDCGCFPGGISGSTGINGGSTLPDFDPQTRRDQSNSNNVVNNSNCTLVSDSSKTVFYKMSGSVIGVKVPEGSEGIALTKQDGNQNQFGTIYKCIGGQLREVGTVQLKRRQDNPTSKGGSNRTSNSSASSSSNNDSGGANSGLFKVTQEQYNEIASKIQNSLNQELRINCSKNDNKGKVFRINFSDKSNRIFIIKCTTNGNREIFFQCEMGHVYENGECKPNMISSNGNNVLDISVSKPNEQTSCETDPNYEFKSGRCQCREKVAININGFLAICQNGVFTLTNQCAPNHVKENRNQTEVCTPSYNDITL
ncbi:hypothetical protein D6810_00955 [Candidatus Dojkabacteria bacterium]|uniref:Uncharacterized protein n=1 Tax=Candidatus Dojkabacteria bacterium TaxID=2099670 RepID=A0A3M0YZ43_9BACT|nr:MAG: hypothetical protein D6810_00955 [Candidatus Dojkabacteria bacterium]